MKKFISSCILISFLLVSCTSTRIVSSWKEPNKQVQINKLSKVLVIALFKSETNRRKAEDQMVGYLNGKGVVSYNYLDADFNKNKIETLRDKIKADGFDGVVTMSLMDVDREKLYVPGNYELYPTNYRTLNGYYARGWANYSTPGSCRIVVPGGHLVTLIMPAEVDLMWCEAPLSPSQTSTNLVLSGNSPIIASALPIVTLQVKPS